MSALKLKPCPFCGGEAVTENHHNRYTDWWEVKCTDCSTAMNERYEYEFEAVEAWNTRKPMDLIVEQLHNAGGCDGTTDYDKGWDAAIQEAERIVKEEAEK